MRIQYSNLNMPGDGGCGCGCLSLLLVILLLPIIFLMQLLGLKSPNGRGIRRSKPQDQGELKNEADNRPHPKAAHDIIDVTAKEVD